MINTEQISIPNKDLSLAYLDIKSEVNTAIKEVLDSNCFIMGPRLEQFESAYASFCGSQYCVGVGNVTDALTMILWLAGLKQDDEVILPSFAHISTAHSVRAVGAKPVFVDIDPKTLCIEPVAVANALTPKTKAVIAVNIFGNPCDYDALLAITQDAKVKLIEDNSHGHGATYKGKPCGSFGHAACHSFYPTTNLGAMGDGGAITTNDYQLYKHLIEIRNLGLKQNGQCNMMGVNSRLDEIQAAILLVKLKHLPEWNKQRRQLAKQYCEALNYHPTKIALPSTYDVAAPVFHQFVIKTAARDRLKVYLQGFNVRSDIHYPIPCHLQKCYSNLEYDPAKLQFSEAVAKTCLSLPLYPGMTKEMVARVTSLISDFYVLIHNS